MLTDAQQKAIDQWEEENDGLYEYCDNHRVARVGDAEEEELYERKAASGCCGSVDVILETPDGPIRYGFNHGH